MRNKKVKGKFGATICTFAILVFNFVVMPSILAADSKTLSIQTITGNMAALNESMASTTVQTKNINVISKEQAIKKAMKALKSLGFDTHDFKEQSIETRYIAETIPVSDPVWVVIFRDDRDGYTYLMGSRMNNAEERAKLAALGEVGKYTDENGISGIRVHYSYTEYTLVEVNALNGKYIRQGENTVSLGEPLNMNKINWWNPAEKNKKP